MRPQNQSNGAGLDIPRLSSSVMNTGIEANSVPAEIGEKYVILQVFPLWDRICDLK